MVRAGSRRLRRGIRVHATRSLHPSDITTEENIACTTPARTLVDLAAVLDRRRLRRALERSIELRLFDGVLMDAALERARGRRGTGVLRELLAALPDEPAPTRNELERAFPRVGTRAGAADAGGERTRRGPPGRLPLAAHIA